MNVSIIGTGAYGIALSLMFYKNNCKIKMWNKFEDKVELLTKERENKEKLPGVRIPEGIEFYSDMKKCVEGTDLIVIAVPAGFVDTVSSELKYIVKPNQHICIASKGIERDTCSFVYDILSRYIDTDQIAVISGPSFAVDIVTNCPIGLSLATTNEETEELMKKTLQNDMLKLRTTKDILGVELCGSIKNVIAIAAGILDGMGYPESTQAMFITESLNDIKNLIDALGGDRKTILSFAGFGDLLLTSTSKKSRNFSFGHLLGSKAPKEEVNNYMNNTTIEGLYTLQSIYKLLRDKQVEMPIIDLIYDIIYKDKDPNSLAKFLIEKD